MTETAFFPYHNRHIVFKLTNGLEVSGVIIDRINCYKFIPTRKLMAWKLAEKENNKEKMQRLEEPINLNDILWAERVNY